MSSYPDNNFQQFLTNGGDVGSGALKVYQFHGVGFNGANPIDRQSINSATATVADVVAILEAFGLATDTAP